MMSFLAKGVAHRRTVTVTMDMKLFDQVKKASIAERRSVSSFMALAAEDFFKSGVAHRDEPVRMAAEAHGTYGKKEHAA